MRKIQLSVCTIACLFSFSILTNFAHAEIIERSAIGASVTRYGPSYTDSSMEISSADAKQMAINLAVAAAVAPTISNINCPAGTIDLGPASVENNITNIVCNINKMDNESPDRTGVNTCTTDDRGTNDGTCYKCSVALKVTKQCAVPGI